MKLTDRDSVPNGNFTLPSDTDLPTYKDDEINSGHEATFAQCDAQRAKETFHTTAMQAGEIARDADVRCV